MTFDRFAGLAVIHLLLLGHCIKLVKNIENTKPSCN